MFYIWCVERNMWWKPNKTGYTRNIGEAGKYPEKEATSILDLANEYTGIEEYMVPEVLVKNLTENS